MIRHTPHSQASPASDHAEMVLDGTKIAYHTDRLDAWSRGERIAPITIDMALTRACDAACSFCYAMLQNNDGFVINEEVMDGFLEDSARMGVRGISLVSDGESLLSPVYAHTIIEGRRLGISMASGTNGYRFTPGLLEDVLPALTYLRFNVSAGTEARYSEIMGVKPAWFQRVCDNIATASVLKSDHHLPVTLGIQMVLMPQDADQILPFARLGRDLGVDYAIIKHCSDDEYGNLGVKYEDYAALYPLLEEAEALSTPSYKVQIKWSKIGDEGKRSYQRCYGPPFLIQISGSGLVAPCGMLFNDRYAKFHIGNICEERWYDIWSSDRYWEVMSYLGSDQFNAQQMCGSLCIQHMTNTALDQHVKGSDTIQPAQGVSPLHVDFV
jgi:MoaA/NifB/PqqE/SkfB family radical SAM enzyme